MGAAPRWELQLLSISAFAASNIALTYFNSWALRGNQFPGFTFPIFYTTWHMLASALASLFLLATVQREGAGLPSVAQFWPYKHGLAVRSAIALPHRALSPSALMTC